jgi:fumarylacetoacetate (FAA) hydrolase
MAVLPNEAIMKLGSLKSNLSKDGELIVVSSDGKLMAKATHIAASVREAIENWQSVVKPLSEISEALNSGTYNEARTIVESELHSAMPRAFQWVDGSAFMQHVRLVRKARGAEVPETLYQVPLMYQGGSDGFLAPTEDIPQVDFSHGTDFEGEVAVITDFVPMGISPVEALKKIRLIVLVNDVSLRGLIPQELALGFGFLISKPSSAFSPFAVTPDELGSSWKEGRVHLPLLVEYNGEFFGKANAGEMHFHFGQLIAHLAQTRDLAAGTIVGSGTVSNEDLGVGSSCLAEKRMLEQIATGKAQTPFMKINDTIKIEMRDEKGSNIFGTINQKVVAAKIV